MAFVFQFITIVLAAFASGRYLGKRSRSIRPRTFAGCVTILLVAWFALTWWARRYGDTALPGWAAAEAWAYSGKWYALLAGVTFGLGFVRACETAPTSRQRTLLQGGICLFFVAVVLWRIMPIHWLIGDGERDARGYLRQSKTFECTCGAVALVNYMHLFRGHPPISEREMTKACRTTIEGSTTMNLLRAAHVYGLTNTAAETLTWNELQSVRKPVIVSISTLPTVLHATLLVEIQDDQLTFIDPAYGDWKISETRFREIWRGKTILFE